MKRLILEACVDNIESAINAQKSGADRIELCSALLEGGLTPSLGLIKAAKAELDIPIHVLIRPRRGDFLYSPREINIMKEDIDFCRNLGIDGVVFGVLNADASINIEANKELLGYCTGMKTTFHRAFDMLSESSVALEQLIDLGFDKILTSGQVCSAEQAGDSLKSLVVQADNRISIIAAGGINTANIVKIVNQTGVGEVHASARAQSQSKMLYQTPNANISADYFPNEFEHYSLQPENLRNIRISLDSSAKKLKQ